MLPIAPLLGLVASAIVVACGAAVAQPMQGTDAVIELPVMISGPSGTLGGIWRPTDVGVPQRAAAVIIPGSGPTDRDGNSPVGVRAAPLRLLAEGLSAHGIASIRIDKRGMFASSAAARDANAVKLADYAADVNAWAAEARRRSRLSCAWIIGHSEGALVALLTAGNSSAGICGVVSMAGPGRRMADVLRTQLSDNPANAPLLAEAFTAIAALENGKHVDVSRMHPALAQLFWPAVQPYLIDLMALDPAEIAKRTRAPLLLLQGLTDLQTTRADAERLHAARPDATIALLVGVNHVLKVAPLDRAANTATYAAPALPLAPSVTEAIVAFISRH